MSSLLPWTSVMSEKHLFRSLIYTQYGYCLLTEINCKFLCGKNLPFFFYVCTVHTAVGHRLLKFTSIQTSCKTIQPISTALVLNSLPQKTDEQLNLVSNHSLQSHLGVYFGEVPLYSICLSTSDSWSFHPFVCSPKKADQSSQVNIEISNKGKKSLFS